MKAMKQREHSLQHTALVRRAYSLQCSDRHAVGHQVALRVVREFNLPDTTCEILQTAPLFMTEEPPLQVEARYHTPRTHRHSHSHHGHVHSHVRRALTDDRCSPSSPVSPTRSYSPIEVRIYGVVKGAISKTSVLNYKGAISKTMLNDKETGFICKAAVIKLERYILIYIFLGISMPS